MSRRTARQHTPAEALAALLAQSYLAAYVRRNPHHDTPGWGEVSGLSRAGFVAVAEELLRRGVRPPLEPVALPVQWLSEAKKKEDIP